MNIHDAQERALDLMPNRFELILAAATRARQIHRGHQALVEPSEFEKPAVTALREIGAGKIAPDKLRELLRR